jgi:hypothetical protein
MRTIFILLSALAGLALNAQTRTERKLNNLGIPEEITYTTTGANTVKVEVMGYTAGYASKTYRITYTLVNNKTEGAYSVYAATGDLLETITYRQGLENGADTRYYPGGAVQWVYNYVNGLKEGEHRRYTVNGVLVYKALFVHDKEQGEVLTWYDDGAAASRTVYVDGKQHGKYVSWFKNGKTKAEGMYAKGRKDGVWKEYWEDDGRLESERRYRDGQEDRSYQPTGVITEKPVNLKKLRGICSDLAYHEKADVPVGRYIWEYQASLLAAAGADPTKDSEEQIGKKIAAMFRRYPDVFKCSNALFDVSNGSLIKFGVNLRFDEFILDIASWNVDVNFVDEADGKTVLDYISMQIEEQKGNASEKVLRRYYDLLRKHGAKHRSEL